MKTGKNETVRHAQVNIQMDMRCETDQCRNLQTSVLINEDKKFIESS